MKKYLFSFLCFTLMAGAISTNQGYTELELQIANNFAKKGIIIDYSKTPELYRLNENITRSELMAIALKIKGVKLPDEFVCQWKYADVVDNNWICRTVELSLDNQLIRSPSSDKNTARPLDVVTRAEALAILLKANGLTYSKNIARGSYSSNIPQWQIDVMEGAVTLKIIPTTQWRGPNTIIKRKEVLWLAHNMKYATGEYKLSTIATSPGLNSAPQENTEAAKKNILNSTITVKQDAVEKLKYTFTVAPKTLEWVIKSVNWYIQKTSDSAVGKSLWTGTSYVYSFVESGKYSIEAKIEDSFGNILTSRMVAEITVIGAGNIPTEPGVTTPPATTTPPAPGTTVSGEAAITTPPTTGDKVSVKINNVATTFTVGDSENTLTEIDEAVRTMKIGDKKNVTISSRTGGKITTNTFVVELVDIQRSSTGISDNVLADFVITAPTEVKVNTAFDVTIKAINKSWQTITNYENNVIFEIVANEADFIFPETTNADDGDWWYQFQLSDYGIHTIKKWFTIKKAGNYEIDFIDLRTPPKGIIKTIKIKVTN